MGSQGVFLTTTCPSLKRLLVLVKFHVLLSRPAFLETVLMCGKYGGLWRVAVSRGPRSGWKGGSREDILVTVMAHHKTAKWGGVRELSQNKLSSPQEEISA